MNRIDMSRPLFIICLLLISTGISAQQDTPYQIAEKVYLHIDRDIYNSGEDIWFKAYVTDFLTNKPSANTNNLHVDLISPGSQILQHRIIRIKEGLGNSDFKLSDSLPSGKYLVRAYTNFMRNFSEEFFFKKEIVVINSGENSFERDSSRYMHDSLYVDLFPEGGSLVDEVTSFIGYKVTNSLGKGVNIMGDVFSDSGEWICSMESTHLGMGVFQHKPLKGKKYYILAKTPDGRPVRIDLPGSFPAGIVIHSVATQDNKLLLKLLTNQPTLDLYRNKDLTITVSLRNLYMTSIRLRLSSPVHNFLIPLDKFPQGVLRLTLNDPDGKPLAERLVFNSKDPEFKLSISVNRTFYKRREPVTATLALTGNSNSKAHLSIAASDATMGLDSTGCSSNIASWFLLESDLRGTVENPGSYFDLSNKKRFEQMDLLLLTQGWRDFSWKYDTAKFYEHEIGFSIRGNVTKTLSGKPFPEAKINIAVFDEKNAVFLTDEADSSGHFMVDKLDITGRARVLVSCANQKNNLTGWIYMDSMFYEPPVALFYPQERYELLPISFTKIYEENREIELFRKKFKLSDTLLVGEVTITARKIESPVEAHLQSSRAYYGKPDKELILTQRQNNYVSLSQLLVGNIPGVEVNTTTKKVTIRGEGPLILIDGIPTGNELLPGGVPLPDVSPSVLDRVDVLYWSSPFGSRGANGVINFITKRGDYNYEALNTTHSKYFFCNGFDEPRIFYSPRHETGFFEGQTPDFRSTLLWQPEIELDPGKTASVNYFNSDKETTISIKVEGITEFGIPVTGYYQYKVER
jgi:hypothetical protein